MTYITVIEMLASMQLLMYLQVTLTNERLATHVTAIRTLATMYKLMSLQNAFPVE